MAKRLFWKEKYSNFLFYLLLGLAAIVGLFVFKASLKTTYYPESYLPQYYQSAVGYYKQHLFASAFKKLRLILKIDPDYKDAHILLGDIYYENGLYREAIKEYQKAIEIDSMDKAAYLKLAVTYWEIEKYELATRVFESMLKKFDPNDISIINNLASCYSKIGLYSIAFRKYKEILRINPRYAKAHYNIGTIYFTYYEDYKAAIKEWIKTLRLDPSIEEARVYIESARYKLKNKEKEHADKIGK